MTTFKRIQKVVEGYLNSMFKCWNETLIMSVMSAVYAFAILFLAFCVIKFIKWAWFF